MSQNKNNCEGQHRCCFFDTGTSVAAVHPLCCLEQKTAIKLWHSGIMKSFQLLWTPQSKPGFV